MKGKNYEIVVSLLSQFPLKKNVTITPFQSLSNILNLFGSLLSERVKAKLIEQFPNNDFSNLSSNTTVKEICSIIDNQKKYANKEINLFEQDLELKSNNFPFSLNQLDFNEIDLGIDLEHINSLPEDIFLIKNSMLRNRLFSEREVAYATSRDNPHLTLLGIFSAKESIQKILNINHKNVYSLIEISHDKYGKPYVILNKIKSSQLHISISHSNDYVVSVCATSKK